MEVQFYIYGVPEGFDLYGGTPDDIGYFQLYYDSSRENAKLTIHRRHNGQVVYSFLCYNLISGGGRAGAFFGMSAVFNGIYCTDTNNLYKLFEGTYKTILQQGILLREANGRIVFATRSLESAV